MKYCSIGLLFFCCFDRYITTSAVSKHNSIFPNSDKLYCLDYKTSDQYRPLFSSCGISPSVLLFTRKYLFCLFAQKNFCFPSDFLFLFFSYFRVTFCFFFVSFLKETFVSLFCLLVQSDFFVSFFVS